MTPPGIHTPYSASGRTAGLSSEMHPSLQVGGMPPGIVLDEILGILSRLRSSGSVFDEEQDQSRADAADTADAAYSGDADDTSQGFGGTPAGELFGRAFLDTLRLFRGEYPGYQACNTLYHDLDHTLSVTLAMVRLMHGASLAGTTFSPGWPEMGVLAALFHDIGYIQRDDDKEGSGAKYTVGHEERGVAFMTEYLADEGFSRQQLEDCGQIIRCTDLWIDIEALDFHSEESLLLGHMLGTADLLAQMADRRYLEKLFYLYREFSEADIPGFDSELDLLRKTHSFYEQVARKRLEEDFSNVADFLTVHFNDMGKANPYEASIQSNLKYLQKVLESWQESFKDFFRRSNMPR
ncbi:MAG: hypothetical protein ACNI3A_17735 [Desulfovibrio sp.]|uniref:hypothetical protein n=1 Tax=Desulfovibrio sp. 7SRBS1 TaxID=3378064 RepID=UPI003B3D4EE2